MARPYCSRCCNLAMRVSRTPQLDRAAPTATFTKIKLSDRHPSRRLLSTKPPSSSPKEILAKPTWSVSALLDASSSPPTSDEEITPKKLHHLLRLSALPLPSTPEAETSLLGSLRAHLRFVREIQAVDTTGVEPLRAIRDETTRGKEQITVRLEDLEEALSRETRFGYRKRPRRVKTADGAGSDVTRRAEGWDPLKTAQRTAAGKYFVVENEKSAD